MTPKSHRRVDQADHWIGQIVELIPENIRRTLATALVMSALSYIGVQTTSNGQKAEQVASDLDGIRQAMRLELDASRTNWTGRASTSNTLVRIEAKLDQLLSKGDKP